MSNPYFSVELFSVDATKFSASKINARICNFYASAKVNNLLPIESEKQSHLKSLLEAEGVPTILQVNQPSSLIVLSTPRSDTYYAYGYPDAEFSFYIHLSEPKPLAELVSDYSAVLRNLLFASLQRKVASPLTIDQSIVYNTSVDLSIRLQRKNSASSLLRPLRIHPGFSFQFRSYGGSIFLQILPQSVLSYDRSILDLKKSGLTDIDIQTNFPYVHVPNSGRYRFVSVLQTTVSEPIQDAPYFGRTFIDFAKVMYPERSIDGADVPLAVVVSSHSGRLSYFPTSWIFPSLSYTSISRLDEEYYSEITGLLKASGKARIGMAHQWAHMFSDLSILGSEIRINPIPRQIQYSPSALEPAKFSSITDLKVGHQFVPPSMMLMRNGIRTEIIPGVQSYQGTVNDLLSHPEIKPLDIPAEMNIITFVNSSLLDSWKILRKTLIDGISGYRGIFDTFGVKISLKDEVVDDFLGDHFSERINHLPKQGFDCALIVTDRHSGTAEQTARTYVDVKTKIMERGIPVQFITDDRKLTFGRDNSLISKSKSPRTLFGIAINILAKAGSILSAIGDSITHNLLPNSMTLGYNVARIFPRHLTGVKSIPLAAPLVIFNNNGSYISHQEVYKPANEVSLFDEFGDTIFNKLTGSISSLIVHKDGQFSSRELERLFELGSNHDIEVIPISIRTNYVPRISNPQYQGSQLGMKAGTFLPLSDNEFLMMTTPFLNWDPDKLGWPNPILITLHNCNDSHTKLKLLYHIYALTKMQTGSQRSVRLPVSIHFSNMINRFLRRVGDPSPTYLRFFVNAGSQKEYLPKWFL